MTVRKNFTVDTALEEEEARYQQQNPQSARQHQYACDYLPGGNTRTVLHCDPFPLLINSGEGATLTDADGHKRVDFIGEYTAGLFGHSHPRITECINEVMQSGILLCGPNRYEAEFARLICDRFAAIELVRFVNSGTEANLMALTAARAFSRKKSVLVFSGGYHGGVLTFAGGVSPDNAPYPFIVADYNNTELATALLNKHADELAAVLVEPMMGTAGAIPANTEFLQALRTSCSENDIVLIFDEVMTSRTGQGGAQGHFKVTPDLTTLGKYMGGGMTFGAFGGRQEIMQQFDPTRPTHLPHAGTFNNNVLTMAAGTLALGEIYTPGVAENFTREGDKFRSRLQAVASERQVPVKLSGLGSLMNVHFSEHDITTPLVAATVDPKLRRLFHLWMMNQGIFLGKAGYIALMLPLSENDRDSFVTAFDEFLQTFGNLLKRVVTV